jgi:hypothetical protein
LSRDAVLQPINEEEFLKLKNRGGGNETKKEKKGK